MSQRVASYEFRVPSGVRGALVIFGERGGFWVDCPDRGSAPFPVADAIALAELFEDLQAPALTPGPAPDCAGDESAKEVLDRLIGSGVVKKGDAAEEGEWPTTLTPGPSTSERGEDQAAVAEVVLPEDFRMPVADDGYEYPPVKKLGENNYIALCPVHGQQALTRAGTVYFCPKKTNRAECTTRIPRAVVVRATN